MPEHGQDVGSGPRITLAVLSGLAGGYALFSLVFSLLSGGMAERWLLALMTLSFGLLYVAASFGSVRSRAWSWMLLAALSAFGITVSIIMVWTIWSFSMMGPFGGMSWLFFLFPGLMIAFHAVILTLALLPSVHKACGPPPAVRGPTRPIGGH